MADVVKALWASCRRARRQLAIQQARHALAALPEIRWHDADSEEQARETLQEIQATVDGALRRVRAWSDEARTLKHAQARLTAWLQAWGDPRLLPPTHVVPMYQGLVVAMRTLATRLTPHDNTDPPPELHEPVPRS
jgi:hypothetical protein